MAYEPKVGDVVARVGFRGEPHMTIEKLKIAKVLKNGNVRLEGREDHQYKPHEYRSMLNGKREAVHFHQAGESFPSRNYYSFILFTPELEKELAATKVMKQRIVECERIKAIANLNHRRLGNLNIDPSELAAIADRLEALLKGE